MRAAPKHTQNLKFGPGSDVNYTTMRLGNLGGDVQTEPQTLLAWLHFAAKEWFVDFR
jgi:hypothetical protein